MTWEEVLKRDDLIGDDIETVEDGIVYRGPLSDIRIEGNCIHFDSLWVARQEGDRWVKNDVTGCFVNCKASPPSDIGQGRIHFRIFMIGHGTIFPKGGSKLDLANVEGLDPSS